MNTALTPVDSVKADKFALRYAEHGNAARAYREAFDTAGMQPNTVKRKAYDLVHTAAIVERVRELQSAAAERTVITVRQQMVALAEMASVDVSELWRLEHRPCPTCHKHYDADLNARRALPDMMHGLPPHADCSDVRAHQRVVMLPLDQWPPAALRLYDGVEMQRDGTFRPVFRDRSQLQDQVNRMLGAYVSKSINLNASVAVPIPETVSSADALAFLKTLVPS